MLKTLALSLLALTAVLTVAMAAKEAVRFGLPAMVVLRAMPFFLIEMVGYALPASILYSACSVYGRMGADLEVTALKSLGVSPMRVVEPVLVIAVVFALGATVSYDLTATWGRPGIRRLMAETAAEVAVGVLKTQRSVEMPWGSVTVQEVHGKRLVRPHVRLAAGGARPETNLVAASGELVSDREGMRLVLEDVEADLGAKGTASYPGKLVAPLPVDDLKPIVHRDWLAMHEIGPHLKSIQANVAELRERKEIEGKLSEAAEGHLKYQQWRARRLTSEPYRRWANGFSCLSFALLGVPLALARKTADTMATFFMAFLPILLAFYPLLMVSEQMATGGTTPGFIFWLPNLVLGGVGIALLRKVVAR